MVCEILDIAVVGVEVGDLLWVAGPEEDVVLGVAEVVCEAAAEVPGAEDADADAYLRWKSISRSLVISPLRSMCDSLLAMTVTKIYWQRRQFS